MTKTEEILIKAAFLAILAYFIFFGGQKVDLVLKKIDQYLLIKAVNECGQVATVTYETDQGLAKTTEPFKSAYEQCLRDKGIK